MRIKPKIAHFIWWIPHYRVPIFKRLSQNPNFDFWVYAGKNTRIYGGAHIASGHETSDMDGLNWKPIKSIRVKGPIFKDFEWQPEAVKIALKKDIDVVISLGYQSLSNILIRIICKLRKIPLLEWTQGVRCKEKGLRWLIRKFYYKWADGFLLYGDFAKDFFMRHGFSEEQLFVVHNSLNHKKQLKIRNSITKQELVDFRKSIGVTDKGRLLVHSGRLEKQKKLDVLIRALSYLKGHGYPISLVLIGEGRERENLEKIAVEENVKEEVCFIGACYDEAKLGLIFMASDLCVAPGAVGLIAMHSLVYGTPLLTCKNSSGLHGPEIEAVLCGKTGDYFVEDDINSLCNKLQDMLYPTSCKDYMEQECMDMIDNYYTPEYQEKVIVNALNYVLPANKQIIIKAE